MTSEIGAAALHGLSLLLLASTGVILTLASSRTLLLHMATIFCAPAYLVVLLLDAPLMISSDDRLRTFGATALSLLAVCLFSAVLYNAIFSASNQVVITGRQPLFQRIGRPLQGVIASLGIYTALIGILQMVFTARHRTLDTGPVAERIEILGLKLTPDQFAFVGLAVVLYALTCLIVQRSGYGRVIRAIASNTVLASVFGLRANVIVFWAVFAGSLLIAIAGLQIAYDVGFAPTSGLKWILLGITAVVIAGQNLRRALWPGLLISSALLALLISVTTWYAGAEWALAASFLLLVVFLIFRPQGLFGDPAVVRA